MANLFNKLVGTEVPVDWILSNTRFQRNYLWDVLLPDILQKPGKGTTLGGGLIGFGLQQLVQKISFGDYSIGTANKMRYGPYEATFAGIFNADPIKITFLKTMPDAISAYLNAWKHLIIDDQGLYQVKSNYQKTIYARFLSREGLPIGKYKFIGCFPITFPSYTLDYEDKAVTTVDVEFAVDRIEYEWL